MCHPPVRAATRAGGHAPRVAFGMEDDRLRECGCGCDCDCDCECDCGFESERELSDVSGLCATRLGWHLRWRMADCVNVVVTVIVIVHVIVSLSLRVGGVTCQPSVPPTRRGRPPRGWPPASGGIWTGGWLTA